MPQNSVFDVVQTRDGYLWLATQNGLARFDGVRFTTLGRRDGLESDEISVLHESRDGALWIGTNGGGVSRLKDGEITTLDSEDGLHSNLVRSIHEGRDGTLWIGTIDGGLHRVNGNDVTQYGTEDGLSGNVVLAIHETRGGDLWIGTEGGLSRLRDGSFSAFTSDDGLPEGLVWTIHEDGAGTVWFGLSGGLVRFGSHGFESYTSNDGLCGNDVNALATDDEGSLWIGTLGGGLCRLRDGRFDGFTSHDGLTNDRVRSLTIDREGNVWAGTERGGLDQLSVGKFTHLTAAEGLSHDVTLSVLEDRHGAVWVGTEGSGVNVIHEEDVFKISMEDGLPSNDVYSLAEDVSGRVWLGMYGGGVCRIQEDQTRSPGARAPTYSIDTCLSVHDGLPSDDVYSIHVDRNGTLWIGTLAGLVVASDDTIEPHPASEELADTPISAIHEDGDGGLWIGTYGAGMVRVRGSEVQRFGADQGLSSEIVLAIHESPDGEIWAGMQSGGLCLIHNDGASCISTKEGFPTDNVLQILESDDRALWLGTLQGILRVDREDIRALLGGHGKSVEAELFDKSDGLKVSEMNGGTQPSAWRSANGLLYFTTNRGLAYVDPAHVRTNTLAPPVRVERITIEDELISLDGEVTIPAGSRDVTFHYTALSFTAPEKVRFQYKLEGYDAHWIDAGARREAYYTNLAPGTYRFLVKAANNDGVWNEEGAAVSFYLEPFFYQTWWFKWMCILAAFGVAAGGYRLRIRQLKERERELERVVDERTHDLRKEKEITEEAKRVIEGQAEKLRELDRFKTKFFANVSHEFRTPLTMIVGPLENMLAGLYEPLSGTMRQQTEMMLRNALRLMRLINQLLDLSKLEDGKMKLRARERDIVSFIEGVVLSCSSFAERKGIKLGFNADSDHVPLSYEPDKLEKVFYNLLSNAIKFTPTAGEISVLVRQIDALDAYPEGAVIVEVSDTGRGIPADQLPYVFDRFHQVDGPAGWDHEGTGIGLALAKEMILLHGGQIGVESELGTGTTFTITLPLGTAHLEADELTGEEPSDEIVEHGGAMSQLATSDFNYMHDDEHAPERLEKAGEDAPLVLVVDDNKDVREYVAGILNDEYRIVTACNGEEGLERAREAGPDLILSDVMMPVMDGNAFCRAVKSSSDLNHIPVILLTARATHQLKIEGLEVGADDYIPKPFNVHELRVRIKNLLRLRGQEKELKTLNEHLEAKVKEQVDVMLEERRRYEEDLITSKERAEASDRLKSNILNNLSHEFRTPLTAILGFTEILQSEAPDGLREFTFEIERGGKRLLQTLESLLELSRIEADEAESEIERLEVNGIVESVVDAFSVQADTKGLDLRFTPSDDADVTVELSEHALRQVLHNLVDNAVKFTPEGEVSVEVEASGGNVHIHVRDTGIGMSQEFLPRMYEAFVQESEGYTRSFEGCGLGLTVARRLIDLIGGTIQVETKRGAGSRFTASFPTADTPANVPMAKR